MKGSISHPKKSFLGSRKKTQKNGKRRKKWRENGKRWKIKIRRKFPYKKWNNFFNKMIHTNFSFFFIISNKHSLQMLFIYYNKKIEKKNEKKYRIKYFKYLIFVFRKIAWKENFFFSKYLVAHYGREKNLNTKKRKISNFKIKKEKFFF